MPRNNRLNSRAYALCEALVHQAGVARVEVHDHGRGAPIIDCGLRARGGLQAGRLLAEICMSGLGQVHLVPATAEFGAVCNVQVATDAPLHACLFSQYAGWKVERADFLAMGSGPMRSAAGKEQLFRDWDYRENTDCAVGVLETSAFPPPEIGEMLAEACDVEQRRLVLLVARTSSLAGAVQIVSRSVETAMHKIWTCGADPRQVVSAFGVAPLPPIGGSDLAAMGRTNDAILYGATVQLWVTGSDEAWADLVPRIPSCSSLDYGGTFDELFQRCGGDFYQMDPQLFSPARIILDNLDTGRRFSAGFINPNILRKSFGSEG